MAKQLYGRFGFQPAFDTVIGQRGDTESQLGLGHAGLHAEWLHQHMPGQQFRHRHFIQPQIAKPIKPPGTHEKFLLE
jgi:hypothetical protein